MIPCGGRHGNKFRPTRGSRRLPEHLPVRGEEY